MQRRLCSLLYDERCLLKYNGEQRNVLEAETIQTRRANLPRAEFIVLNSAGGNGEQLGSLGSNS